MKKVLFAAAAAVALGVGVVNAAEMAVPKGTFGKLDRVFLIIMENQTNTDILGNPYAPFINWYATVANQETNYFAVGHPSAPNYLELVGGSNFGLTNDYWPNWVTLGCIDNEASSGCGNAFTPINVAGMDNTVVATAASTSQSMDKSIPSPPQSQITARFTPTTQRPLLRNRSPISSSPPGKPGRPIKRACRSLRTSRTSRPW